MEWKKNKQKLGSTVQLIGRKAEKWKIKFIFNRKLYFGAQSVARNTLAGGVDPW